MQNTILSVKVSGAMLQHLDLVGAIVGMGRSELVRHILQNALDEAARSAEEKLYDDEE